MVTMFRISHVYGVCDYHGLIPIFLLKTNGYNVSAAMFMVFRMTIVYDAFVTVTMVTTCFSYHSYNVSVYHVYNVSVTMVTMCFRCAAADVAVR